jgi:hypothetical protein
MATLSEMLHGKDDIQTLLHCQSHVPQCTEDLTLLQLSLVLNKLTQRHECYFARKLSGNIDQVRPGILLLWG